MSMHNMTAPEFHELLVGRNAELAQALLDMGGLRGLFDVHSAEFKKTGLPHKISFLRKLRGLRIEPIVLESPFIDTLLRHSYPREEAARAFKEGLAELLFAAL